jgi:hypothetical protein
MLRRILLPFLSAVVPREITGKIRSTIKLKGLMAIDNFQQLTVLIHMHTHTDTVGQTFKFPGQTEPRPGHGTL